MAKLEDVCSINMGQSPESSSYNETGEGIPFFQGNADFGELHPTVRVWCNAPTKIAKQGDILISVRAPIGALNIANVKCCIGRGLAALSVNERLCYQKYLWYALECKVDELNSKGTGSTFKAINKKTLAETEISLPPLDEQRRIAAVLDKVSGLIAKRREQMDKLDELVKVRFVEMFGDVASNPNGYPIKHFDEVSILITDGEHATPRRTDKGIYLLSARNVLNHKLQLDDVDYIDEKEYNRISRRIIPQAGDVLISCSGSIGRCCTVPDGLKFQMVRSAALIRFDESTNPVFAEWLITSDDLQQQIAQSATQSSQANLFQGKIRKLRGFIPPIELQNQFVDFVVQTDKSKLTIQQSLDKLEVLKKALMQQYFG